MNFPIPATISKITTMHDRTLRLQVELQETTPETNTQVFALHDTLGYFFFSPAPLAEIDPKDLPPITIDDDDKSPSKRLHDRMFVYFQKKYGKTKEFNSWYMKQLDIIGQSYLDKMQ